ncbi:MAG TPA: acyl-CoA dehydrogenase family protein [Xanthobacteraceae bacterium]|nr:acyl-CoA dehydrogenase family protein [Xanthobacteraceae bacterium]
MYSLHLSPEQLEIRDTVRDFVAQEVVPAALVPARLEARVRPLLLDVLDKASQMGLRTLALSEQMGGAGADHLTCCIVTEELAFGDPDIAAVLAQTSTLAHELFDRAMTDEQRGHFLPAFLEDDRYQLALAEHEPDRDPALGVNYHRPKVGDAGFKTTAKRSGDVWIINGAKDRVANAPLAGLFAVQVATGNGASTLLVPRNTSGLAVADIAASERWHHGAYGTVTFKDCRVPAENLLGIDEGSPLAGDAGHRIPQDQALNLGIGRAAYEAALDYAQLRVQGGRRIIEHQAIGGKLAEVLVRLEVARAAIWQAAWASDHPAAIADRSLPDLPLTTIAEAFVAETIYHATKDAAECFGAMGVMKDMPLQKYVHDALVCLHSGAGKSEATLRIAEALSGYRRPALLAAE